MYLLYTITRIREKYIEKETVKITLLPSSTSIIFYLICEGFKYKLTNQHLAFISINSHFSRNKGGINQPS